VSTTFKRTTVYLEPDLHHALRQRAVETSTSLSDFINKAVPNALIEDTEDLAAFEEREGEPLISYEALTRRINYE
jgi:hypothetical protein